ncbi:unnamed protein product [Prorocentrum cordatum]|uniref:Secreted protein n=1 Tax=Prorocentrum cordatum TaxID=2364126 RepID=A0ABN9WZ22_9DINO|nr:unnamed protein product [Polarella glacialis]
MHKLAHSLVVACLLVFQGRSTKRPSSSRRPGGAARKGRARLRELCGGFGFLFHNLLLLRLARTCRTAVAVRRIVRRSTEHFVPPRF